MFMVGKRQFSHSIVLYSEGILYLEISGLENLVIKYLYFIKKNYFY